MPRFVIRRLLMLVGISIAIIYLAFVSMGFIARRDNPDAAADVGQLLVDSWGETTALLLDISQGSLGMVMTISGPRSVAEIIRMTYYNSFGLLAVALGSAALLGLYIGVVAAVSQRRWLSLPLLSFTVLGVSAPSFLLIVILQQAGIRYSAVVGRQLVSMGGFGWDYQHMLLPGLVLAARPLAYITRSVYVQLGRIMEQDYIRTAFAKGFRRRAVVRRHAFRNLFIPYLTAIGVSLRFSLSTLLLVEFLFGWPGIGRGLMEALSSGTPRLVAALALVIGLTIQGVNFLLDMAYRLIDPRIREESA